MTPPKLPTHRRRPLWGDPLVVRSLIALLVLALGVELLVILHHFQENAPVREGVKAAASAERGLGAGPLNPRASRIDFRRLDARAQALVARKDMAGLGIAVVEDGQLAFIKTYGETSVGSGQKVTPQTQFRWASLSKGVAATMVTMLAAEHKLSLQDPISKWSSSLKLPHDNQNVATIEDVLSHRLGIVKNAYDDKLEDNEDPVAIRGMLAPLFPMCPPGTCFAYENVAYDAAHEVVEKATGLSYDEAARRMLFDPLGMTSASTTRAGYDGKASWAPAHVGPSPLKTQDAYFRIPAAGGVSSSIVDLGIWLRAQMGGAPNVLPQSLLFTLHAPRVLTPKHGSAPYDLALKDSAYGLGFRSSNYEGHHLVWHRGAIKGSRSLLIFDPQAKFGVAMLWNSSTVKPTGLPTELLDEFYGRPFRDWMELGRP